MSNAAKLAEILKRLGDAHYQAADELIVLGAEQPQVPSAVKPEAGGSSPAPADSFYDEGPIGGLPERQEPEGDQGSLAVCPKHRKPYKDGNYGPYCTSTSDDPAWANRRGYCTINPKNAAKWLEMHGAPRVSA